MKWLVDVLYDVWLQKEANKIRLAVGLETKPVELFRRQA